MRPKMARRENPENQIKFNRNSWEFLLEIERDSGHVGLALENSLWTSDSEAPSQAVALSSGMGRRNR